MEEVAPEDLPIVARINSQMTPKEIQKIIKDVTISGGTIFCENGNYPYGFFVKPTLFQQIKFFLLKHILS